MMDLPARPATQADLPALERLLEDTGLITAGVRAHIGDFLLVEDGGRLIASGGLEQYGPYALLRSVAVIPAYRNRGAARYLVSRLLDRAAAQQVQCVYLFTSTAPAYFRRFGFVPILRGEVAEPVRASEEYGECCSGAETMVLRLRPADGDQIAPGAEAAPAQP
jgi:amino-acid N-acetyltransferase